MAETKQVSAGTKLESIGTVKTVVGEVKAVDAAGNERILQAGDKVFANETIVTANGGMVMIEFADGTHLDLASASKIVLDTDVFNPANAVAPKSGELTAEQIQEMIARGEDPTAVTEASAAGAGAGDEGGSSFIVVDFNNTQGNVNSGFNTLGIPGPEGTTFTELPPVEDEAAPAELPPEVTVVVVVTPPPTEENPNPQPGVGTNAASIVEGTAEGSKTVVFTIVLDKAFAQDVTVTYVLVDGAVGNPGAAAANNPSDYSDGAGPQTIVIPAGQTSFQVTAQIVQDGTVELDEAFSIVLISANNATINPNASSATVTIVNDDFAPVANDDTASIDMSIPVPPPQSGSEEVQSPNHSVAGNVLTNDTDANFDVLSVITPVTLTNADGTLQIAADGSFTFTLSDDAEAAANALDDGETLVVTFPDAYQATDGSNPSNFADVTITITGTNDTPTITVDPGNPRGGNDVVNEAGLPAGSDAAANSEFAAGTFTVSDPDGLDDIASVTINGDTVAIGNLVGHVFAGAHGTLTVTDYSNGVASYTYQLTSPTTDGEGTETDSFTLTTSDGTATSAPASITIEIVDDVPNAVDDTNSIAEDAVAAITGNVLTNDLHTNDQPGADTPTSFVSWTSTTASYGTFTDTGNGTYSYTLNNSLSAVQGLDAGETLTETFTYTMQDADGDPDTATLTITITGSNDTPTITVDNGNEGGNDVVYEAGLPAGSDAAANSEFAAGTFTVSDPDGLDDIASVTINGDTVAIGNLVGHVFAGAHGTLTVTDYSNGVASYTYQLTSPTTDGEGTETDSFTLTTSDGTATSAPASITIEIVDDVPNAVDDTNSIAEDAVAAITGNVLTNDLHTNGQPGADTPTSFVSWTSTTASYGTFTDTGNGTYSYTLNNGLSAVQGLDAGETLTETFTYTMQDADGDPDTATLTITITGSNDTPTVTVDSGNPQGANDVVYEAGLAAGSGVGSTTTLVGGTFTVADPDGLDDIQSVTINGTTIAIGNLGNNNAIVGANGTLTITGYSNGVASYTYQLTSPTTDGEGTETDSFTLTTSDGTATSAPASITIEIVDDVPNAVDNTNSIAEDTVAPITGNVLTNDLHTNGQPGADTPTSFVSWTSTTASYGTFTDTGNGTYSYTLNNSLSAVQGLDAGETLTETFTYTMQDADGDPDTATLTITITGSNDTPTVTVDSGNPQGANDVVYEAGLAAGSGVGPTTTLVGGTFTVADPDGLDDIQSVSINGGAPILLANLVGTSVVGPNGTLTITGYSNGVASYTYQLTSRTTDGAGPETNTFTVTTSDGTATSAPASITIEIVDDVPRVTVTGGLPSLSVDETTLALNDINDSFANVFSFNYGADGAAAVGATTYSLGVNTSSPTGLIDTATGQTVVLSVNGSGVVEGRTSGSNALVFRLSVDSTTGGAVLDQVRAIKHDSGASVDSLNSANLITLTATITDGDGDTASQTVNIGQSISFYDDGPTATDTNGVIKNVAGQSLAGLINYDLGADGTGTVNLSYTGPALTSHGKAVTFSLVDTNNDGIKELVGKADLDGNAANGSEATILTLAVASGDATPANGSYTLTLNDVIDQISPVKTISFTGISAGGPIDEIAVTGQPLLISAVNPGADDVNANNGFVGINNNIMNDGESIRYEFGTVTSSGGDYSVTAANRIYVNDVKLNLADTGSGTDSFHWKAYTKTGGIVEGDITTADGATQSGAIHVDASTGGYYKLEITMTDGAFKVGGISYTETGAPQDLNLSFSYTATDGDGDAVTGSVTATVSATATTALSGAPADINTLIHTDHTQQP